MDIKHVGHSCFVIKTKTATIVTDPYLINGVKIPKLTADIITVSHNHGDHNNVAAVAGEPLVITYPGEYEKQGVRIVGFPSFHDKKNGEERGANVMYKITVENTTILHCGDLGHALNKDILEQMGDVDILLIPVGGFYTIDSGEAASIAKDIEPKLVIPMHYNETVLPQDVFGKLTPVDEFLKKIGQVEAPVQDSFTLGKDALQDGTKVMVLKSYGQA